MRRPLSLLVVLAALSGLSGCGPERASIIGVWKNQTNQILEVHEDLHGALSQATSCAPVLGIYVHRDPYDAYAVRFNIDQKVYFPPIQKDEFGSAQFFCSSSGSNPMCRFCQIHEPNMTCESTDQSITGFGTAVKHDCTWTRQSTGTVARVSGGSACGKPTAASPCLGTMTSTVIHTDGGVHDASDAGRGDAARTD